MTGCAASLEGREYNSGLNGMSFGKLDVSMHSNGLGHTKAEDSKRS